MKKYIILVSILLSTLSFQSIAAPVEPVSGVVIEQARGGVPGLEFGVESKAANIANKGSEFKVQGRLGHNGVDFFTFSMEDSFDITLDLFIFEKELPTNSALSGKDITYKFILVDHSNRMVRIPQGNMALFTDLKPGTYKLGIISPATSAAIYDLTIAPSGFFASLPIMGIGIGFIVILLSAAGLMYRRMSKK